MEQDTATYRYLTGEVIALEQDTAIQQVRLLPGAGHSYPTGEVIAWSTTQIFNRDAHTKRPKTKRPKT